MTSISDIALDIPKRGAPANLNAADISLLETGSKPRYSVMIYLRQLQYFVSIADAGSFSRAAALIHIAQPALSIQIANLEALLDVKLFCRTVRGVSLTQAGEILYSQARSILRQVEQLPSLIKATEPDLSGEVVIGMPSSLVSSLVVRLIKECRQRFPKIYLKIAEGNSVRLRERVLSGEIEIALSFQEKNIPGLQQKRLFRQRLYYVTQPGSDVEFGQPVSHRELSETPLILPSNPNILRVTVEEVLRKQGFGINAIADINSFHMVGCAVRNGLGGGVLPLMAESEDLDNRPIEPPIYVTASLITSNMTPLSAAALHVHALLVELTNQAITEDCDLLAEILP